MNALYLAHERLHALEATFEFFDVPVTCVVNHAEGMRTSSGAINNIVPSHVQWMAAMDDPRVKAETSLGIHTHASQCGLRLLWAWRAPPRIREGAK